MLRNIYLRSLACKAIVYAKQTALSEIGDTAIMLHLKKHIQLWEQAQIQLITVNKHILTPREPNSLTFPSSSFLCICKGNR